MNILIIDNSIAYTGAFKCALNEAELLRDKHNFIFVLNDKSTLRKAVEEKGFKVYQIPMVEIKRSLSILLLYPLMLIKNTLELSSIVKKEDVDLVQANDFYNLLGAMLKKFGYKGKLITYVRFLPSVMPSILRNLWIKQGLKHSDNLIAVSDAVLKQLPDNTKAIRIYDPIKLSEKHPGQTHTDSNNVQILYLSNYIKGKGQDHALEAFAKAYAYNKQIRLTFMGGDMGLQKNAQFRAELEQRANDLGLSEVVTFSPFNSDVEAAIKSFDIVVNFSEAESFSMTCLEAAFYGTALIATKCGGPEEIIDEDKTGLLVPVGDVDAMSNAILELANNPSIREQYAEAGRAYVRNKFNIEQYLTEMNKLISEQ
ncbi:MAG: glycosyltransferase family 4 protein [Chitinophagales bacterium]|nr:glycosyltransferase family 4 protein [Chitinophagaceae bacterium]MCB9065070.1 glycosyltransferase family 4 protein [Chitinophagales bacterium]